MTLRCQYDPIFPLILGYTLRLTIRIFLQLHGVDLNDDEVAIEILVLITLIFAYKDVLKVVPPFPLIM